VAAIGEKKYHIGLAKGEVGEYVLVPGDPGRTPAIAKYLDDAREIAFSREYRTFTGSLLGVPVSTISSGMGGPSVAIAVEELSELGVHTFLRVGIIRSVDALYSDLLPDTMPRPRQLREELDMWSRAGVLSNDMESSTLFVVSRIRKLRAGTINLCVDELGAGEIHHLDPKYMDRMLRVAVDAVKLLIERDRAAEDK